MRIYTLLFQLLFISLFVISCGKTKTEVAGIVFDPETTPFVYTENVSTLISDSGITRFRIEAERWDMFSKAKEPYWYFPKKIHVERFDTVLNIEFSIDADTAYYFQRKKLWKLIGNVKVVNLEDETFTTTVLFWDEGKAIVYTDEFVRVMRKDEEITGIGFFSNQEMTNYRFYKSGVSMSVKESSDSTAMEPVDSTAVKNE